MVNKYITRVWESESKRLAEVQGNPRLCREFQNGYRRRKFLNKGIAHDRASNFNLVKW